MRIFPGVRLRRNVVRAVVDHVASLDGEDKPGLLRRVQRPLSCKILRGFSMTRTGLISDIHAGGAQLSLSVFEDIRRITHPTFESSSAASRLLAVKIASSYLFWDGKV